ncbi:MAG: sugar phosphate isomerase/epimerase [Bacteroidia bacterium]|nr:sugar phosphate isomerase/epimerase [Bacteroidia bacterium]
MKRREFFIKSGLAAAGIAATPAVLSSCSSEPRLKISLAEWSLHRALGGKMLDNLEFPVKAKRDFGITAVEYVSSFFADYVQDPKYLAELKRITDYHAVTNLLIMVDGEGDLGESTNEGRLKTAENHIKWVDAAQFLGCHSIRVNAGGSGSPEELAANVVQGLRLLCAYGQTKGINVIVENHGGHSSDGGWLSNVIKAVKMPNVGTLPDFGNFRISEDKEYDRYKGMEELMPFAKGVSAKSNDFDKDGNETTIDFARMMQIVKKSGYHGYIDVEYEGSKYTEEEGIMLTKKLLEKLI